MDNKGVWEVVLQNQIYLNGKQVARLYNFMIMKVSILGEMAEREREEDRPVVLAKVYSYILSKK